MKLSHGFSPVAGPDARILILGSMPGAASLEAVQYYAFPRNVFWNIMGELFAAGPELDYPSRLQQLISKRIALWDVLRSCARPGSLDADILEDGMTTNNFVNFFAHHPCVSHVYFNGQKAAGLFKKKVAPGLNGEFEFHVLPSTSPAHAAMSYAAKLEAWSKLKINPPTNCKKTQGLR
jgi:hypoxanthine-DNA glycosylase